MVAITDDMASPLTAVADCEVLLRSAATGSPTGFFNVLIVHDYVASILLNEDSDDFARTVATATLPPELREVAASVAVQQDSRLSYIWFNQHAAAALYAALLTNNATGIDATGPYRGARPTRPCATGERSADRCAFRFLPALGRGLARTGWRSAGGRVQRDSRRRRRRSRLNSHPYSHCACRRRSCAHRDGHLAVRVDFGFLRARLTISSHPIPISR